MNSNTENTILVVDDNPINRDVLVRFLASRNFSTEEAVNGFDALEKVKQRAYMIILMDLLMPGLDGFETVKEIRRMGIDTPIIAQSSLSFKQDREQSIEVGCNDFLPKPIRFSDLLAMIEKYRTGSIAPERKKNVVVPLPRHGTGHPVLSDMNVLLVEEEDEKAELFLTVFERLRMKTTRVFNGGQAWENLMHSGAKFHVIVSNVFTSGIDGLGLLNMVKRQDQNTLVVLYSEDFGHETYQLALKLGADGILPYSLVETSLSGVIESAIYRKSVSPSWEKDATVARQVRKSQEEMRQIGFIPDLDLVDVAISTLHDAGGDTAFFRRFNLAGRYGFFLMDVAGHDVVSSYISAMSIGILSSVWDVTQDPIELLHSINLELLKLKIDQYHICVTAILWDVRRSSLKIATAGNPGGLHVSRNSRGTVDIRELEGGGMCLGLFKRDDLSVVQGIELREGDYLFFFSDGISVDILREIVSRESNIIEGLEIKGLAKKILDEIKNRVGQTDDMVLLVLKAPTPLPADGFHYEIKSSYEEIDRACDWVSDRIREHDLPEGIDPDLVLMAVREVLLNAVEHGNKKRHDSHVDLSLQFFPKELRVEISDEGPGFDLNGKLSQIGDLDMFSIGRRGLPLMQNIATRLEVTGGTVSLTFTNKKEGADDENLC